MPYIPLIEHSRPRILMLDFPEQDVAKVKKAGYEARRGATGLFDREEFYFPYAVQDVEILFAEVRSGSFTISRLPATDSVEDRPFFKDLVRETWEKLGWIVLFVAQDTEPVELETIGLDNFGVVSHDRDFMPASAAEKFFHYVNEYRRKNNLKPCDLPKAQMPRFKGQGIITSEDNEMSVINRFIKPAKMSVIACEKLPLPYHSHYYPDIQPNINILGKDTALTKLIHDESVNGSITALKLHKSVSFREEGSKDVLTRDEYILVLPDFGNNNGNVALALLQEVIPQYSPHLFDTPSHSWLENYQSVPVQRLQGARALLVEETLAKIEEIDRQTEQERERYNWLQGLLVAMGDEFASYAAQALRFLGFEVDEVDEGLAPKERKREDFRITDDALGYFAIGEAKTTGKGRGVSEEFINKTQTHQMRYTREHGRVPKAMLIANYAIALDPVQRVGLFYSDEAGERLEDNDIRAINSAALFDLCQFVLDGRLSKEQVRKYLTQGQSRIASVSVEAVTAT